MPRVLHLYDSQITPSAARQLRTLRVHRQALTARFGPTDDRTDLPEQDFAIRRRLPHLSFCAGDVLAAAQSRRVDVIHCWTAGTAYLAGTIGVAAVASVLDTPDAAELRLLSHAAENGVLVAPASQTLARLLVQGGIAPAATELIPPAVTAAAFGEQARSAARRRFGLADEAFVVVLGRQAYSGLGQHWGLWATTIVRQVAENVRSVIVGPGPAAEKARQLAEHTGIADEAIVVSEPADPDGPWQAGDLALLTEPNGMGVAVAAKAIAGGLPIIAARAGELGEMLVDGQTALLTDPGKPRSIASAIWRLLSDRALGARLAENARRQFAASFDADAATRRFDDLYARAAVAAAKVAHAENAHDT